MRLIVISNSGKVEDEAGIFTKLFESGLETLHLRKPRLSTSEMKKLIKAIPEIFHSRIIIHSHHKLASKFNLKGIHLTKSHRSRKFKTWLILRLIRLRNPNILVTTSHRRLATLFEEKNHFDYVFLSPIFDSLTSKYQSGFTEHSLRSALTKTPFKVIARGGVDIHSIERCRDIGFEGMALYSTIWKKPNPVTEFNKVIEECSRLGITIE